MILITGGAYQGKSAYLHAHFPEILLADSADCSFDEALHAECITNYHILIERLISANMDPIEWTSGLCKKNPECIILMNEIGSGIIPIEKTERIRRELTGICGCIIASHAQHVIRLTCGIPAAIKGELL